MSSTLYIVRVHAGRGAVVHRPRGTLAASIVIHILEVEGMNVAGEESNDQHKSVAAFPGRNGRPADMNIP